ncbi:MAG: DUF3127 domain-containing protein [Bacteroidota bacterium]
MFNITGTLKVKTATQQVSDKFKKREFVIVENSSPYPQFISFQLTQDKCSLIDNIMEGNDIKVYFNLRGREWQSPQGETKYFNSLEAWKIEMAGQAAPQQAPQQFNNYGAPQATPAPSAAPSVMENFLKKDDEDDLPF